MPVVELRGDWYGFDPIHIQTRQWRQAWSAIMQPWREGQALQAARPPWRRWLYLRTRQPQWRRLLGVERMTAQPCGELPDGSTIALY